LSFAVAAPAGYISFMRACPHLQEKATFPITGIRTWSTSLIADLAIHYSVYLKLAEPRDKVEKYVSTTPMYLIAIYPFVPVETMQTFY
jgi:hypothetical protein